MPQERTRTMKTSQSIDALPRCQHSGCEGYALQVLDARVEGAITLNPKAWLMGKRPIMSRMYSGMCMEHHIPAEYRAVRFHLLAHKRLPIISLWWKP